MTGRIADRGLDARASAEKEKGALRPFFNDRACGFVP
jgi:hypothetical protein